MMSEVAATYGAHQGDDRRAEGSEGYHRTEAGLMGAHQERHVQG